jgi:hypothetical protein
MPARDNPHVILCDTRDFSFNMKNGTRFSRDDPSELPPVTKMFHRSSSSTSSAFSDLTNAIDSPDRHTPDTSFCESFSSECGTGKRPLDYSEEFKTKRCRLGVNNVHSFSQAMEAGDKEDQKIEDIASESRVPTVKRRPTIFGAMTAAAMGRRRPGGYGLPYRE